MAPTASDNTAPMVRRSATAISRMVRRMAECSLPNWAPLCSKPRVIASRALAALLLLASPAMAGQRVSIELVLAVDVSSSVNDIEYALQMKGMAAAFSDKDVIDLIGQHKHGVVVTMTQWSGTYNADQPLPWQ